MRMLQKAKCLLGVAALIVLVALPGVHSDDMDKTNTQKLSPQLSSQVVLHGFLLWVSMGFLMPIGILIIRFSNIQQKCGRRLQLLFYFHVIVQVVAVVLATAGAVLSIKKFDNSFSNTHQRVGIGLYSIIWIQVAIGCFRPKRGSSKERSIWFFLHWLTGTAITLLGIINVYTGLHAFHKRASKNVNLWTILFTAQISFLAFLYLLQDKWLYIKQQGVVPPRIQSTKCTNEVHGIPKDLEQTTPHQASTKCTNEVHGIPKDLEQTTPHQASQV